MSRSSTVHSEVPSFKLSLPPVALPAQNSTAVETSVAIPEIPDMEKQDDLNNSSSEKVAIAQTDDVTGNDSSDDNHKYNENGEWKWAQNIFRRKRTDTNQTNDTNNV